MSNIIGNTTSLTGFIGNLELGKKYEAGKKILSKISCAKKRIEKAKSNPIKKPTVASGKFLMVLYFLLLKGEGLVQLSLLSR